MFKDKYKKAMDSFTPKDETDKKIEKLLEEEGSKGSYLQGLTGKSFRRRAFAPILAVGLVIIMILALWPAGLWRSLKSPLDKGEVYGEGLEVKVSYERMYKLLSAAREDYRDGYGGSSGYLNGGDDAAIPEGEEVKEKEQQPESYEDKAEASIDYSETNLQEEDVDEADIVKTDGKHIYMSIGGKVQIAKADEGKLTKISTIDFSDKGFNIREMYLQGNRLAIIGSSYKDIYLEKEELNGTNIVEDIAVDSKYPMNEGTIVYYFDVQDPGNPKNLGTTEQSGFYVSSRVVEGSLYLITNKYYYNEPDKKEPITYVPTYKIGEEESLIPEKDLAIASNDRESSYLVICAFSLENRACTSSKAILGAGRTVYASKDNIYVAMTKWKESIKNKIITAGEETMIIGISIKDGILGEPITGTVPGYEINQFAMDEHKGYLRIVTTETRQSYEEVTYKDGTIARLWKGDSEVSNGIYVLDKQLKTVGGLSGLAPDEFVYSVRFYGDIAYFVTFRQVDPLFTVDLSNPKEPVLIGSLKIPGFSDYLQAYGEGLLFGFGQSATEEGRVTGLKLSMFDISNQAEVREAHVKSLDYRWSEASYNHKAILATPKKNIIAFAVEGSYLIYGYDNEKGFYERASIDIKDYDYNTRGIYIGDFFYVCTSLGISSYDMNKDFQKVDALKF